VARRNNLKKEAGGNRKQAEKIAQKEAPGGRETEGNIKQNDRRRRGGGPVGGGGNANPGEFIEKKQRTLEGGCYKGILRN